MNCEGKKYGNNLPNKRIYILIIKPLKKQKNTVYAQRNGYFYIHGSF
jgi:hypothetical protein